MNRSPLAALTAILAAALFVFGTAAPALAHDTLKSSNPAKGAEVDSLDEVRLEFSNKVRMPFVLVRGDGDAEYQSGKPEADGAVVTQAVKGPLPDGKYTIAYRVVSSDGHPIEGEIPFRVKGAEKAAEEASPSAEPSDGAAEPAVSETPQPAESAASPPDGQPSASVEAGNAAAEQDAQQDGVFPVWLIVVVLALIGFGIGLLISARKKQP